MKNPKIKYQKLRSDKKNKEARESFYEYCFNHPDQRFWQALSNWSGFHIRVSYDKKVWKDPFYESMSGKTHQLQPWVDHLERFLKQMFNEEDLKKHLSTPKDISMKSNEDKAAILTLHFIGYLAKPIGIDDILYRRCLEAFNNNRGKVEWEEEAVLKILNAGCEEGK